MTFSISPLALTKIKEFRPNEQSSLRLKVLSGGCSGFRYDLSWAESPEDSDKIILIDDIQVFIENKSSLFLNNSELDYVDALTNSGFKINSNAFKEKCGCGQSFST